MEGRRYFDSERRHGMFVRESDVLLVEDTNGHAPADVVSVPQPEVPYALRTPKACSYVTREQDDAMQPVRAAPSPAGVRRAPSPAGRPAAPPPATRPAASPTAERLHLGKSSRR